MAIENAAVGFLQQITVTAMVPKIVLILLVLSGIAGINSQDQTDINDLNAIHSGGDIINPIEGTGG